MKVFTCILVVFFLCNCSGKPDVNQVPPEPNDLLSQEKITEVMVDMQLLEATVRLKLIRTKKLREKTPGYYDQVLEKHDITEENFKTSLDFYASQHEKITAIYDSVEVRLTRMKDEMDAHEKGGKTKDIEDTSSKKQ